MTIYTLICALLAFLALSFIIFLHELGHFLAARWAGMKVDTFSVGFGRPIKSWKWNEVQWQIGCIPFGGYVSIQGLGNDEKREDQGSYFQVAAYKRMIVVAMGPIVNLALAWFLFAGVWALGGQIKNFADITHLIGWVDFASPLAGQVKPGDKMLSYDKYSFHEAQDHIYAPLLAKKELKLKVEAIDYQNSDMKTLNLKAAPYSHPESEDGSIKTVGILSPARQLFIQGFADSLPSQNVKQAGAQLGDRIVAVNGMRIFSEKQLFHALNDHVVLLTIQRGAKQLLARVPTFTLAQLCCSDFQKTEIKDWHYLSKSPLSLDESYWLGFDINEEGVIEGHIDLIDAYDSELAAQKAYLLQTQKLEIGDKILEINGKAVQSPSQLFEQLQQPLAVVVIERKSKVESAIPSTIADADFITHMQSPDLKSYLANSQSFVQDLKQPTTTGSFIRLEPVNSFERGAIYPEEFQTLKNKAALIVEEHERAAFEQWINKRSHEKILGLQLVDQAVVYNPGPNTLFSVSFWQMARSLSALVNAQLSPKWLVGPIGMVSVVTHGFSIGITAALNWLAVISLSLGVFNLLPLPIFDGGRLLIDGFEALTGRKINPKVLDAMAYVFVAIFIMIALTATYWDVWRLWASW